MGTWLMHGEEITPNILASFLWTFYSKAKNVDLEHGVNLTWTDQWN